METEIEPEKAGVESKGQKTKVFSMETRKETPYWDIRVKKKVETDIKEMEEEGRDGQGVGQEGTNLTSVQKQETEVKSKKEAYPNETKDQAPLRGPGSDGGKEMKNMKEHQEEGKGSEETCILPSDFIDTAINTALVAGN